MDQATELLVLGQLANAQQDVADGAVEVVKTRLAKAIDLIRNGDPDAPKVSYAPCITGKIEIGDKISEFRVPLLDDSVTYFQWGATPEVLGSRVDLLEAIAATAREWVEENICRSCKENLLDDGEGWDGECGDCADRTDGLNPDCECSEFYRKTGNHTPGCPADEG